MASTFDSSALIGGGVGGLLGLVGGISGAITQKKTQTKFRRRQREAIGEARDFTSGRLEELLGEGTLFSQGTDFLSGTFGAADQSPLAQDFVKQIRAAQASRGTLFGGAPEAAEAGGLAAFSQQLRASLLPQLLSFTQAPEQLRQSILGFEAPLRVAARTGASIPGIGAPQPGVDIFGSGLAGLVSGISGGAQVGSSFGGLQNERNLLAQDRRNAPRRPQADSLDQSGIEQLMKLLKLRPEDA